ncbi:TonB-dependent receptor [Phenylobacterium sp. SCN 70-31]|uniref:TonB-dependent receptor n=1 Tax=Phenylobacterium sp. SCN 70-31 TaxID=1660129 RepID=UPI00086D5A3B|nr:TonB-dependent receptor [Phenylobacterium sp. SCN 70-31]ODT86724.1 MAG: hypothetical protein ABS78_14840 [Phenylobacterium sp. SCN 70-31]
MGRFTAEGAFGAALVIAMVSGPVLAAEAGQVEELVVTAFKREETVLKAPAAISALSGAALQARGLDGLDDIQFAVPSLQSGKMLGTTAVVIRGVGLLNQGSPGVAIHTDGVYQPRPTMGDLVQADLERVEVLRGPQGTLYGRNANGGAINFITRAPSDQVEGYVQGSVASYAEYRLQSVVNVPLGDRVRTRTVVNLQDRNKGFVENVASGPDMDEGKSLSARIRTAIDITERLTADISLAALHDDGPTSYFVLNAPPTAASVARYPFLGGIVLPAGKRQTTANGRSEFKRSYSSAAATLSWNLDDVEVRSISSYARLSDDFRTDSDASNVDAFAQHNVNMSRVFTQELNVSGTWGPLDMVVGAYFMNDRAPAYLNIDFPLGLTPLTPGSALTFGAHRAQTKAYAIFADGSVRASERLRLLGGVRYSVDEQEVALRHTLTIAAGPTRIVSVTCPLQDFDKQFESFTPRAGVQYDLDGQRNVYATVSRGFKAGGFNLASCGQSYRPEKVTAYETGFKGRLLDGALTLGSAAFYYDYTDLQLQQIVGLTAAVTNAGKAKVRGVEFDAVWTPDDHWTLNASGALLKATYSDFVNVDGLAPTLGVQDVAGNYLNNAPKRSLNVGAAYRIEAIAGGTLTARVDASYRSRIYFREFNTRLDSQGSYTLVNANLVWDSADGDYRVRLFGTNLFDKAYVNRMGSADTLGARYVAFGAPRQVGVELRRNF